MLKLLIVPIVLVLLGVQFAFAQGSGGGLVVIDATVHPDNSSNPHMRNNFAVDTFSLHTTDTTICPTGIFGCTYHIEKGAWGTNIANSSMFVFEGTLKASSGSGLHFFDFRADLSRNSETMTSGHDVTILSGLLSFANAIYEKGGNNITYNVPAATFDNTNSTLKMLGLNLAQPSNNATAS